MRFLYLYYGQKRWWSLKGSTIFTILCLNVYKSDEWKELHNDDKFNSFINEIELCMNYMLELIETKRVHASS